MTAYLRPKLNLFAGLLLACAKQAATTQRTGRAPTSNLSRASGMRHLFIIDIQNLIHNQKEETMSTSRSLQLATFALAITGLTGAYAQDRKATPFLGPAIGVSANSVQTSLSYNGNSQDIGNKSATAAGVFASWGFELTSDWVLTTALAYHPESIKLASEKGINTEFFPPRVQTLTLKSQDEWVLSVAPGYRIRDNHLVYAKLSYHTMEAVATSTLYAETLKQTIEAPGVGLGYAFAITPHLQVQGEFESISFSRSGLTKSSQDVLRLGVAYRF